MAKIDTCEYSDARDRSRWELECLCLWADYNKDVPAPLKETYAWTTIDKCAKCKCYKKIAAE